MPRAVAAGSLRSSLKFLPFEQAGSGGWVCALRLRRFARVLGAMTSAKAARFARFLVRLSGPRIAKAQAEAARG
jgi:hypothetical protein